MAEEDEIERFHTGIQEEIDLFSFEGISVRREII